MHVQGKQVKEPGEPAVAREQEGGEEEKQELAGEEGGEARTKSRAKKPQRTFKEWYLEKFTDAFAEDLDRIRVQVPPPSTTNPNLNPDTKTRSPKAVRSTSITYACKCALGVGLQLQGPNRNSTPGTPDCTAKPETASPKQRSGKT